MSTTTSPRGDTWSEMETLALIHAWSDRKILEQLEECHRNETIYTAIADNLAKQGYKRDWKQCRTKCKHLKAQYKKYKDGLSKSGSSRGKPPKHFDILDRFLGDRPEAVGLENAVDTSTSELDKGSVIVQELVAKYKRGKVDETVCPQCGYELTLQTAGVHETESGSLKIYSEDEELHCPSCGFVESNLGADQEPDAPDDHVDADTDKSEKENKKIQHEKKRGADSATPQKPRKKAKRVNAFEKAVEDFITYQKESDDKFLNVLRESSKANSNTDSATSSSATSSSETMADIVSQAIAETLGKLAESQLQSFDMQF